MRLLALEDDELQPDVARPNTTSTMTTARRADFTGQPYAAGLQPAGTSGVHIDVSTARTETADNLQARLSRDLNSGFAVLVDHYQRVVYTAALRLTGLTGDAEDLAAETFLRAYQALRGYSAERIGRLQPRPWLITILLNLWRNQIRAARRRPNPVPLEAVGEPETGLESPEQQAQRRQRQADLGAQLTALPDTQRAAVVFRHIAGLSYAELATVLGCPEGTAKSHVSRGLHRLRQLMTDPRIEEDFE
jgi:RNA polymerase sigma-70 factor (ECF subfamily)